MTICIKCGKEHGSNVDCTGNSVESVEDTVLRYMNQFSKIKEESKNKDSWCYKHLGLNLNSRKDVVIFFGTIFTFFCFLFSVLGVGISVHPTSVSDVFTTKTKMTLDSHATHLAQFETTIHSVQGQMETQDATIKHQEEIIKEQEQRINELEERLTAYEKDSSSKVEELSESLKSVQETVENLSTKVNSEPATDVENPEAPAVSEEPAPKKRMF